MTAVYRLVDRRRGIDRLAVSPHALVPALTKQVIRLPDHRFAGGARFGSLPREDRRHRACARQRFVERLAVAA